jgi:replicative DNA helicase
MSLDSSIISYAIRYNDLIGLQRQGVTVDDFVDEFRTVWKHILKVKKEHDTLPSRHTLGVRFPDLDFPRVRESEMPMLVAQLRTRRKFTTFLGLIHSAADQLTDYDKADDAVQWLQGQLNGLAFSSHGQSHMRDFFAKESSEYVQKEMAERAANKGNGIKTGLKRLDAVTGGLHKQQMVTIIARTGVGKAQPLSEPVLTPEGWTLMGSLCAGDQVVAADGKHATILQVHPQGAKPIYRVGFHDGSWTEATSDHLWSVTDHWSRKLPSRVVTTEEMSGSLGRRYHVPMVNGLNWSDNLVTVDPYVLGCLLGDGCLRDEILLTSDDPEIPAAVAERIPVSMEVSRRPGDHRGMTYALVKRSHTNWGGRSELWKQLDALGVTGKLAAVKAVPVGYLWSSETTRLEVLRGLMDTDGTIDPRGAMEFSSTSLQLITDVVHLVQSLGGTADVRPHQHGYRTHVKMPSWQNPFRLPRKAERFSEVVRQHEPYRKVVSVDLVRTDAAQCITIDHPDQLYVTRNFVVTHNSWLNLLFVKAAVMQGKKVILYPLEMSYFETAARLYTLFSSDIHGQHKVIKNFDIIHGKVDKRKIVRFMNTLEDRFPGQLYVADVGLLADPYTNERIEAEVEAYQPDMFWVDYLTLLKVTSGNKNENEASGIRRLSNGIKGTATRRNVVGGCSAQVNREGLRAGAGLIPRLEHISFGDSIGHDSDLVIGAAKDKEYLYYGVVKNRNGPEIPKTRLRFEVNRGKIEDQGGDDVG